MPPVGRLDQYAQATVAGDGTVTLRFPVVRLDRCWTGAISIPASPLSAQWTPFVGAQQWPAWQGPASFSPIQGRAGELVTVNGAGLTAGVTLIAYWLGIDGDNNQTPYVIPSAFPLAVQTAPPAATVSGTPTSVASANADTGLLAANPKRIGAAVFNDSTANLFLLAGAGAASASTFTVKLTAGQYYEIPFGWPGQVRGYWDSANGFARVTEYATS